jgi:hypothetical protein
LEQLLNKKKLFIEGWTEKADGGKKGELLEECRQFLDKLDKNKHLLVKRYLQ